jgi:hypothetical protein
MPGTVFREKCHHCGSGQHGLSNAGLSVCETCSLVIDIAGPSTLERMSELTYDEYRDVILKVAGFTGRLPWHQSGKLPSYKARSIMTGSAAARHRCNGQSSGQIATASGSMSKRHADPCA